jgi:hypothetical protein
MTGMPAWIDSDSACTYSDEERFLGFIVKAASEWIAFDGTHPNEDKTGLRLLGSFPSVRLAKQAVERESRANMPPGTLALQ